MPRDLDGACPRADHAISGIRMKTKQSCDSSVPTTAPAVATEKEWTLTLTEHAFVIGGAGIKPIWFERRGNQNREQLESLVAAHNSALGSETQMPMGVASEET